MAQINRWLLVALILTLGFGQLLRFDLYGVPFYLHDVLVVLTLLLLFLQGQALQVRKFDLRGLALLGAGLSLSWLFALFHYPLTQLLVPALYTLRLLAYLALYFLIKASKLYIPYSIFLFTGLTTLIIGLAQYFLLPDMRFFQYLGWDDHWSRLTLPHFDPTFTGVMLAMFALTLKIDQWFIGLMVYFSILLTYSRSVWLSLVMTGLLFIKNKNILLMSVVLLLVSIFALPRKFGEGTNLLRTYSISSRYDSDLAYIQKYKWDLLIGRGTNTLVLDAELSERTNHATGPNNSYLYLLLTSGVLGLIGWGLFMSSLYQQSTHKAMIMFFFLASLFNNVMFYPFALLWVLLIETQQNKLENLRI